MKSLVLALLAVAVLTSSALAAPESAPAPFPASPTARDGHRDFDFEFGTWRTHYRILRDRLVGSHAWYDCYGTSLVRPFWGGSGNLEDGDLKCPNRYVGGMTLRTYDARTHQWTLWWGTKALGISPPQQTGHFNAAGTGDFYSYDTWKDKPVIVRFRWTSANGNPRFEQAFSADHGRTWETNWTTDYQRVPSSTPGTWNAVAPAGDGHDGFDFLLGKWHTHYMRLRNPLGGGHDWYACDGSAEVRPFWGGGANLEEGDLHCPGQSISGMTLRLYDPATHQWSLYWGTQKSGLALPPQVGRFDANGAGDFYAPDTYDGKPIDVRYHWALKNGNPRFEEAFSTDKGKTWLTVWTTDYTRL
jgi:hypothetical protein